MSDKPSMSFVWPGVIAAVLAVYGYVTFTPSLETARPPAAGVEGFPPPPSLPGVEAINARLWEDPLSVVYETKSKTEQCPPAKTSCDEYLASLQQYLRDAVDQEFSETMRTALAKLQHDASGDSTANLLVLPVLLPGDRYGDDRERRMRIRYSVVSGLSLSDYRPKFHKRLSFIELPVRLDSLSAAQTKQVCLKVPVELYVGNLANGIFEDNKTTETIDQDVVSESNGCDCDSEDNHCNRETVFIPKTPVLVCWLDENRLGVRPLATIAQILDHLLSPGAGANGNHNIRAQVRILGPSSSDILLDMAYENDNPNCFDNVPSAPDTNAITGTENLGPLPCGYLGKRDYLVDNVRIYSPMATIAHEYLRNSDPPDSEHALSIFTDGTATASGVIVIRTIGTDVHLARAVKRELQLRNAWPEGGARENDCHVVLIAERDTQYGRAIIENYSGILGTNKPGARGLTTVAYLRGLDGETHNQKANSEKSDQAHRRDRDSGGRPVYDTIEPEGKSQYDYLDRLNRQLADVDRQLLDNGKRGITAIGVVGSDVFDKLLILRAMRKSFPNAQFFTTDLDANFWRKTELATTRNVIVASHFGLTLHPDLQRDVPPFRNSYQTSFFLATLLATDDRRANGLLAVPGTSDSRFTSTPRQIWEPDGPIAPLQPLLFEIGRHGPFQLTTTGGDTSQDAKHKRRWTDDLAHWRADPRGGLTARLHPPSARESLTPGQLWNKSTKLVASAILFAILVAIVVPPHLAARTNMARAAQTVGGGFIGLWTAGLAKIFNRWGIQIDVPRPAAAETGEQTEETPTRSVWTYLAFALLITVAITATALLIFREHLAGDGEPFGWFEGISIWPSMILLAVSALMSGYFLKNAYQKLKENEDGLRTDLETPLTKSFDKFRFDELPTFGSLPDSIIYSSILTVLFFLAAALLFGIVRWPFLPYRGAIAGRVAYVCSFVAYALLICLAQFVLIHVRRCRNSIKMLDKLENTGDTGAGLRKLIELVARRTDEVGKTLQYPFIILLVMYIAQLRVFDDWRINVPLIVLWAVLLASLFWSALQMRRDAQNMRRKIVRNLTDRQANCVEGQTRPKDINYTDIIAAVNKEDRGAYRPWTEDHLLRALAIPLGGSGGLLLLQQWILN